MKHDVSYLKQRLDYDPDTGRLVWRFYDGHPASWNTQWANKEAFTYVSGGRYRQGAIDSVNYHAHQIAWAMHYGEWPTGVIDHINGNGADNKIANLRVVTVSDNAKNAKLSSANSSGVTGVTYASKRGRWQAQLVHQKRCIFLGYFDDMKDAIASRKKAEVDYGFHVNHGREEGFGK
jgi:hypothetical protein